MRSNKESKFGGEVKVTVLPDVRNISNQQRGICCCCCFLDLCIYVCVYFLFLFFFFHLAILTADFQSFYFQNHLTILVRSVIA